MEREPKVKNKGKVMLFLLAGGLKEMTSLIIVFCIAMALILLAIGPVLRMQIKKEDVTNKEELTNSLASK